MLSRIPYLFFGLIVFWSGCSTGVQDNTADQNCICTLELRTVTVRVENKQGNPVTGIRIETQPQFSGDRVDIPTGLHPSLPGEYVIFSDTYSRETSSLGDTIVVRGYSSGNLLFEEDFVIGLDSCGCHVQKLSGPDVIIVDAS